MEYIQRMTKAQLYPLALEDDPHSLGKRGVLYWMQMKNCLAERLSSKTLKEVCLFINNSNNNNNNSKNNNNSNQLFLMYFFIP